MSAGLALLIMLVTGTILVLLGGLVVIIYRRRGQIGQLWANDQTGAVFSVAVRRYVLSEPGDRSERKLKLVIACDGVFLELVIDDGAELLHDLYKGRAWVYGLEQPTEVE